MHGITGLARVGNRVAIRAPYAMRGFKPGFCFPSGSSKKGSVKSSLINAATVAESNQFLASDAQRKVMYLNKTFGGVRNESDEERVARFEDIAVRARRMHLYMLTDFVGPDYSMMSQSDLIGRIRMLEEMHRETLMMAGQWIVDAKK